MLNNKYIAPLLGLLFCVSATAAAQALPTQKDKYDFLRWYLKKYNIPNLSDSIQQLERPNYKITNTESLSFPERRFTKKDIEYIKLQLHQKNMPTRLDTTLLQGNNWRKPGSQAYPYTYISLPVFSRNKHIVLINRSNICGPNCSDGNIEVYIRDKDGNWVW
ncbi:hypothetical protein HQ865_16505 [Mucilaginibacter mali]|uniref:Uncharacterized protein n=1 Tax=Mucilaginibacter mali TaxID=2740462 RepID=A0A7D4QGQ3_9SPHI|nr:hypothetical protein [Mucilaginibacter mali]QKJ31292.1 hypothetical protein HQ865_16505 [Mucilaginibacter mali]